MLEISDLTRRFGNTVVLNNVSLSQNQGEVASIVGPSGCGKSTLLRLVAGLDTPDTGEIRIGGDVVSAAGRVVPPHKRAINMVFQDYALWPHMRVARIIGYGLNRLNRADRDARVGELLKLMRIEKLADRLPSELSGGQQQRVAIARALATKPRILLLDEPLSNLDVQLRTEMRLEFADLFRVVGATVLYVTHDPLEASSFADRLIVMRQGRIEQQGAPEALFSTPSSEWVAMLAGYDVRLRLSGVQPIETGYMAQVGGRPVRFAMPAERAAAVPGGIVDLMLHPASIRFGAQGAADDNHLSGIVSHTLYEGRQWRASLKVGGDVLSLLVPFRCEAGDEISFSFSSRDAVAFPKE
jgi:ABC-type Fe3+/spermidine/putrescine transport system ATPase subunit